MTNLHLHLQKAKRLGVNLTVLATSISLAACGGGGSEGYYGNNNSGGTGGTIDPNTGKEVKEATGIALTLSKDQLNNKGDELTITAKAVDKDGGGVAGKKINLNIANALTLGATSDASEKITDDKGEVTFTVKLNGTNQSAQELLLTTTLSGTTINNVRKVVISGTSAVVQSQYEIKFDSANSLKVTGGEASVRVRAVDINGGGVPNQSVMLGIKNFATQNDVSIKGVSTATTDNEGYANFTVQISKGTEASRTALIQSGVPLVATLTEQNGAVKTQVTTLAVASVAGLVTSLTLATSNNNKVDAVDGKINVVVNAKNPEGLVVANQDVSLVLDEQAIQYGAKLMASTVKTDVNGNATFSIQTEANSLNPTGQLLVQNGITTTASLQASDGTVISSQSTKISVVSTITDEVSYLTAVTPDQIEIKGGQAVITVTAVDKNGGTLANKRIALAVKNSAQNGIVIKEGSQQATDANGKATFTLQFNTDGVTETTLASLLANGVDIGVAYAKSSGGTVSQTTRVQFYTKQAQNPAVDRLEMSVSKGVVNASNDSVELKIRAIDEKGNAAANQAVKFELTADATQHGVRFDGSSSKVSDANGYVSYTLYTAAPNSDAIDKLIASGITAKATSGSASQTIQVMVQVAASEAVGVSYLSMSAEGLINTNKGQTKVTVKAVDSNGGVLVNRAITLKIAESQKNGLTLVGASKLQTDSEGKATFTVSYDGSISDQALLNQLKGEGVLLTAEYQPANNASSITQTTRLRYYEQNINADVQQLTIDLSKGVAVASNDITTVTVKALDEKGQAIIGRKLSLSLSDVAKNNGISFAGASSVVSDASGEAKFTIKLAAPNTEAINALTAAGILLTASTEQNSGTVLNQTAKLMVAATAQAQVDVTYLTIDNLPSIDAANSTERTVKVRVFNSSGAVVANKDITLALNKTFNGIGIKEGTKLTTNVAGEVSFTLVYNAALVSDADKIALQAQGLTFTASYTGNQGTVSQTSTLAYYTLPANISRMDLVVDKGALAVDSTTAQTVNTLVILKDSQGNPVANRQVTLTLDSNALQNGVSFTTGGLIVVNTESNGQATIPITVNPLTNASINSLVASGISINASAVQGDGSEPARQTTKVNVLSSAVLSEVGYLTTTSSDTIATSGGNTTITVNAFNKDGAVLAVKNIGLKLNNVPAGVSLTVSPVNATTGSTGATFNVSYTPASGGVVTAEQIKALLAGINATATYTNGAGNNITQSTIIQFNQNDANAANDIQRLELVTSKGLVQAGTDTLTLSVKATGSSGTVLPNKLISLGLSLAATTNGVTTTTTTATTDAQGIATFTLNVSNTDEQKIKNLVANGIDLAAATVLSDGTMVRQNTKVMAQSPESANPAVASLQITPSKQTVSNLGDSTSIIVRAVDKDGNALKDKEVNFALAPNLSSRLSVNQTTLITDSKGFATFTVSVAAGTDPVDRDLLQSGITFAVTTVNTDSPIPVTQVGKINVTVPQESTNLTISSSKTTLLASGDTAEIYTKLVDNNAQPIKSSPVSLVVVDSALNGVTIEGANNAITDVSGNAKFSIKLTKITDAQYQALLANGVTVRASITLSNGVVRSQDVHLNVNEAVSQYHLVFAKDKSSLSVDGDKTLIAVTLLDAANQPVKNEKVTLTARNIAGGVLINGVDVAITTTPQTVTTDEAGRGFFTLAIPATGFDKDLLERSNIVLDASHIEANGAVTKQVDFIDVFTPTTSPSQTQPARYSLRISSAKPTLNVRNDSSDVTVTLVDQNGGGISGKYVTLSIADFARNGASIFGASGLTTDANGQAIFKVKVDETVRAQTYLASSFATDDLNLTAKFSETGYFDATQMSRLDVVQAVIAQPVASIVIGVNSIEVGSSSDGVYYTRNLSASVVDFDGKPLANQEVALDITPLNYTKGGYSWDLVTDALGNQSLKWVYHDSVTCPASATGTSVTNAQVTNIPVKVPTFLGSQGTTATYTTDVQGKFDFTVRYPKIYAQWLDVRIGATSTVSTLPNRTVYDLGLPSLADDYSDDGTFGPNLVSPYGTTNSCP